MKLKVKVTIKAILYSSQKYKINKKRIVKFYTKKN